MATQDNRGSDHSRETGACPRLPDQIHDPIHAFGETIPGPEERQSRVAWGSSHPVYRVMKEHRAYRVIKERSRENMGSQQECAKQLLAASKLKREASFLKDALEIFKTLFELQKRKSLWETKPGRDECVLPKFISLSELCP